MPIISIWGLLIYTAVMGYVNSKDISNIPGELDLIKDVEAESKLFPLKNKLTDDSEQYGGYSSDLSDEDNLNTEKRLSSFMRIGKKDTDKRLSSFMRIGRMNGENDWNDEVDNEDGNGITDAKRLSSFMRIGKDVPGYGTEGDMKRFSSFVRIGKSDPSDLEDSADSRDEEVKRLSSFVRIGKATDTTGNEAYPEKRMSSFMRIGRDPVKRLSSFMRIGRGSIDDVSQKDKKASAFVRIGKRSDGSENSSNAARSKRGFIRIGKIPSSAFMRIGRKALLASLMKDRYLRANRLGQSSFVRIGKRDDNKH